MSIGLPYNRSACHTWTPKFPFDMMVVYEDAATRLCAERLFRRLFENLEDEYDFQGHWNSFAELSDPVTHDEAASAAAAADMIMVSLRTGREVPPHADSWVEAWLNRKEDRPSALVALVQERADSPQSIWPVRSYLQTVARLGRMDFFFHSSEMTPELPKSIYAIRQRSEAITPALEESLSPRYASSKMM